MTKNSSEITEFYAIPNRPIESEAERLQSVANKIANPISLDALGEALHGGGWILDIGAGADSSLGSSIEDRGCGYIAVEPNKSFIEILKADGLETRQGHGSDLPVDSNSVNAVHMRFLLGWLNKYQRASVLQESLRVLVPGQESTIAVIDYDWHLADGPREYMEAVAVACEALESFGFDYAYGNKLSSDMNELLGQSVPAHTVDYLIQTPLTYQVNTTLGEGLPLLTEAVSSLQEGLNAVGDLERESSLFEALQTVRNIDPNAEIRLPGIIVQVISVNKSEPTGDTTANELSIYESFGMASSREQDVRPAMIPGVVNVTVGSELDNYIRRIQAAEYLKEGILASSELIEENGFLCEESYSEDVVRRSLSFATMPQAASSPAAAVRLVKTKKDSNPDMQLRSLPTAEHLGLSISDRSIFPEDASPDGVIEVSAFVRNSIEGGRLVDMARVIIGAAAEANERGYHTGLMTTQKAAWRFLKGLFGEENFKVIKDSYVSDIHGASPDVEFTALAVDVQSFLEGVHAYTLRKRDGSKTLAEIGALLDEYFLLKEAA